MRQTNQQPAAAIIKGKIIIFVYMFKHVYEQWYTNRNDNTLSLI